MLQCNDGKDQLMVKLENVPWWQGSQVPRDTCHRGPRRQALPPLSQSARWRELTAANSDGAEWACHLPPLEHAATVLSIPFLS